MEAFHFLVGKGSRVVPVFDPVQKPYHTVRDLLTLIHIHERNPFYKAYVYIFYALDYIFRYYVFICQDRDVPYYGREFRDSPEFFFQYRQIHYLCKG